MDVPLSSPLDDCHSKSPAASGRAALSGLGRHLCAAELLPIDPIKAYIGNDLLHVPPEQYARIAASLGLDQLLWLRYWHWFSQVLHGDPVTHALQRR